MSVVIPLACAADVDTQRPRSRTTGMAVARKLDLNVRSIVTCVVEECGAQSGRGV